MLLVTFDAQERRIRMNRNQLKKGFILTLLFLIALGLTVLLSPATSLPEYQAPRNEEWYYEDNYLNNRITTIEGDVIS